MSNSSVMIVEDSEIDQTIRLPDEILHHIYSFLPYTSLAKVKFVCRRIHSFWNTVSQSSGSINGLEAAIKTFLDGINASDPFRNPWRLGYTYGNRSTLRATVASSWQLHLDFISPEKTTGLFHLSLEIPSTNKTDSDHETTSFHVRRLHLTSVSSYLTSSAVSSVVSSFDSLQSLQIEGCRMNSLYISAPELRELTVLDCFLLKTVHVNAPKLRVFRFRGGRPWFMAKGLDKTPLEDAMLDFRSGSHSKYLGSKLNLLLSTMKNVECLTLCRATYEEIITSVQFARCEKFQLGKLKELWWIDNSVDNQRTNLLLSFLRICPMLEKLFITIDPKSSWSRGTIKRFDHPIKYAGLSRLEFVKIEGCFDEEAASLLAGAIAVSAVADPVIFSRTIDGDFRTYVKMEESVQIEKSMRIGCPGFESAELKHAFKPAKAGEERMIAELKHAHRI